MIRQADNGVCIALAVVPLRERGTAPTVGLIAPHQEPYTPVLQALLRETEGLARPAR